MKSRSRSARSGFSVWARRLIGKLPRLDTWELPDRTRSGPLTKVLRNTAVSTVGIRYRYQSCWGAGGRDARIDRSGGKDMKDCAGIQEVSQLFRIPLVDR